MKFDENLISSNFIKFTFFFIFLSIFFNGLKKTQLKSFVEFERFERLMVRPFSCQFIFAI
jgi:ABC-type multidrug transport system permease subunit